MSTTNSLPLRQRGVTVVELMLALVAIAVLATIAVSSYRSYTERARNSQAVSDITVIQTAIGQFMQDNGQLPSSLSAVSTGIGAMKDPWGNAYQYVNHATDPKGQWRKDKNIVPINSDYDVFSMGPDGASVGPLTAAKSRDDIVRANNGRFVGLASVYDP